MEALKYEVITTEKSMTTIVKYLKNLYLVFNRHYTLAVKPANHKKSKPAVTRRSVAVA